MSKDLITGGEALMRALEHQGVSTIFGYPGGSIMPVFDALFDHQDTLNHILVRHEQGAAHAAQGYARVSGEVGVCRTGRNCFSRNGCFSGSRFGRHHPTNR